MPNGWMPRCPMWVSPGSLLVEGQEAPPEAMLEEGKEAPPGWTRTSNHAGVVSRESIRTALTHVTLLDTSVEAADARSACLQAPNSEQHCTMCSNEFGTEHFRKVALVRRALCGDNAPATSDRAETVLRKIGKHSTLKEETIGTPSQHLGGKLRKVKSESGEDAWAFGSAQHEKEAIRHAEDVSCRR